MLVTVKPPNREEFRIITDGEPVFTSSTDGFGYESAQIPCQLDPEQTAAVLGGRLCIHGKSGIVWQGIVTRRPSREEPLIARGWGWCGTFGRAARIYAKTDFWNDMKPRFDSSANTEAFTSVVDRGITITQTPASSAVSVSVGDWAGYYYWGDTPLDHIDFSVQVAHDALDARIYKSATESALTTQVYTNDYSPGITTGTADLDGAYGFFMGAFVETATSPNRSDTYLQFFSATLYGTDLASLTTANIVKHILANEVGTDYLPSGDAYLAHIAAEATVMTKLEFTSCDANTKLKTVADWIGYDFWWGVEMVAGKPYCVPHFTPKATTPTLVIRLDEAESFSIDEAALDELVSVMRVNYTDESGKAAYVDVPDTDATHPLVRLGITRYEDIDADGSSAALASAIGTLAVAEKGRAQVKGSVTTRYVYSDMGADVYLPTIRAGEMVRVMGSSLPQGAVDCIVRRVECVGDGIATITLDNEPYRLDVVLAQLERGVR